MEILAELVLLLHLLWILWVILGWIVTRNRPLLRWFHIGSLVWGILTEVGPWPCPLTIAEQWLERRASSPSYQGSFLIHYLEMVIYPAVSPELVAWASSSVCVLILGIYAKRFWQEMHPRRGLG